MSGRLPAPARLRTPARRSTVTRLLRAVEPAPFRPARLLLRAPVATVARVGEARIVGGWVDWRDDRTGAEVEYESHPPRSVVRLEWLEERGS